MMPRSSPLPGFRSQRTPRSPPVNQWIRQGYMCNPTGSSPRSRRSRPGNRAGCRCRRSRHSLPELRSRCLCHQKCTLPDTYNRSPSTYRRQGACSQCCCSASPDHCAQGGVVLVVRYAAGAARAHSYGIHADGAAVSLCTVVVPRSAAHQSRCHDHPRQIPR